MRITTLYRYPVLSLKKKQKFHPFHILDQSPWPIFTAFQTFNLLLTSVCYFHRYMPICYVLLSLANLALIMLVWGFDVIREGTFLGHHTLFVQKGLRLGFLLFLATEVMFFASFFWAFFHSSLSPTIWIGGVWPPLGVIPLSPWKIPLLNTCILLLSGATVTLCQASVLGNNSELALQSLFATISLGLLFTLLQIFEYKYASFSISDGIYGSLFYMMTGFHGFHVIVGTIFLIISFFRLHSGHFSITRHLGLEVSAWYWHFVDVVWLFLYAVVYIWSNSYK